MNVNEILSCLTEEQIKDYKDNAIEMKTTYGQNLDDIVIKLEKLRRQGKLMYYADFNGTKLYSLDVTMDSAFKECLNCTRKTWLRREKRWLEEAKMQIEKWKKEAHQWCQWKTAFHSPFPLPDPAAFPAVPVPVRYPGTDRPEYRKKGFCLHIGCDPCVHD